MDSKLLVKLLKLKGKDKIEINNEEYIIKERIFSKATDEYHSDITRYELGNEYVLEIEWGKPTFFQIIRKTGIFFKTAKSKIIPIKTIQIKK